VSGNISATKYMRQRKKAGWMDGWCACVRACVQTMTDLLALVRGTPVIRNLHGIKLMQRCERMYDVHHGVERVDNLLVRYRVVTSHLKSRLIRTQMQQIHARILTDARELPRQRCACCSEQCL
jgi:hypothetical protein